ncbi:hypothetical protein IAT38_001702 [Cryptococcus sp. DSM 104549]
MSTYTTQPSLPNFEAVIARFNASKLASSHTTGAYYPTYHTPTPYTPAVAPKPLPRIPQEVHRPAAPAAFDIQDLSWTFRTPAPFKPADPESRLSSALRGRRTLLNTAPLGYILTWAGRGSLIRHGAPAFFEVSTKVSVVVPRVDLRSKHDPHLLAIAGLLERLVERKFESAAVEVMAMPTGSSVLTTAEVDFARASTDAAVAALLRQPQFSGFVHVSFESLRELEKAKHHCREHGLGKAEVELLERCVDREMGGARTRNDMMRGQIVERIQAAINRGERSDKVRYFVRRAPELFTLPRGYVL